MNKTDSLFKTTLSAIFTAIIVICALITVPAPVPFTLQTLGVFVACIFLGFKWSFLSVLAYIFIGALGLPVFSGFQGGLGALFGPTGGFIIGFLFIPVVNGVLSLFFSKKLRWLYLLIGLILCYALGSVWFMVYSGESSYYAVLLTTVLPFVLPDLIKLVLAFKVANLLNVALSKLGIAQKDKLSPSKIKGAIKGSLTVYAFDSVDSTNTKAASALKEGVQLPALFIAQNQTAGRGRRGRSFYSNGGLYMTLALPANYENNLKITTLSSVAVAEAVEELTGLSVGIKWVNDIYLKNKKICGILCENVKDPNTNATLGVIVGVGVNLNVRSFPKELKTIAAGINAPTLSKNLLAAKIAQNILTELKENSNYISRYKKRSIVLGKEITFEKNGAILNGLVKDITENGALIVKTESETIILDSGEISVRIRKKP